MQIWVARLILTLTFACLVQAVILHLRIFGQASICVPLAAEIPEREIVSAAHADNFYQLSRKQMFPR